MSILVSADTQILIQGITGREAATFAQESIAYGAKVVAGVTPGKGGTRAGPVPVFDTVAQAQAQFRLDASVISVPAPFVKDAALEALAHGIRLVVIITERVPRHDVVFILEEAAQTGARVIGPNSLGLIVPGETRVGMCGGSASAARRAYTRGRVAVLSRSGGMTTEIASLLTMAGLGQSVAVSLGGDPIIGSTYLDLLPLLEADPQTDALVLFAEPGGVMEEQLAEHLMQCPTRLRVAAFVAGRFAERMQGVRFGHAGSIVEGTRGSPQRKIERLTAAGVRVAQKLSEIPQLLSVDS
ncbi:MAG: succinate--CoA ligase subunit alpha [Chloroflexi bacterium]|nr:succinate--CoA ligase subunit alpha [Chloroflexota bacterium]